MKLSFLFSLIYVSSLFAQTAAIKKNLDEMFFKVPLNAAKFEVRTMLHSSENFFNISDFDEINKAISSDFKENYKFTYLTNCCRIVFWFENDNSNGRKISIDYSENELSKCIKQYEELKSIFGKISYAPYEYKTVNFKNEEAGIAINYKSKPNAKKPYIFISYRYFDQSKRYHLEVQIYEEDI